MEMPAEVTGLKVSVEGSGLYADDKYTPDLCPVHFWVKVSNFTSKNQEIVFPSFRLRLDNGAELVPDELPGSTEPDVPFKYRLSSIQFIQAGVDGDKVCLSEDCPRVETRGRQLEAIVDGRPLILSGHECRFRIGFNVGEPVESCTLVLELGRPAEKIELEWEKPAK
jgi:hypothetical protein